ncbi:efflux RND transporter periplasmic adaptor subunit [bacterium]|nr:efflux RND transporter periplasmic adaptor subunit [FCB group bacterium]MBL7191142.1 efflux RND transporter periplasmic adaptor subunit [bacterium]
MAQKKSKKKILIIAGVIVIVAAIVGANVFRRSDKSTAVQFSEVKRGTITQTVSASGKIRPVVEVKISAKVSGTITSMNVQEGDSVHKGDLLLTLDRERYSAAKERSESALKSTEASLWKAEAEFQRAKELYAQKLASEAELQTAEANYKLAVSQVEQYQAALKEAADDLSKTQIYSPMNGVVSQLNKEQGEMTLGASFQEDVIMVIADLTHMEAEVEVDENDVVLVSPKDPVKIEIDAFPDTTFKGEVTHIANSAVTRGYGTQEEVTNFMVKVALLDKVDKLRPGMSATVDIEVDRHEDALNVPIQCLAMRYPKKEEIESQNDSIKVDKTDIDEDDEKEMIQVIFVVKEDSARMTPVKTGISSETEIEILEGIAEGDTVVSGPYRVLATTLKDGDAVKEEKKGSSKDKNKKE